ncbi:MAG TPA: hypothetical protein GYA06_11210 [Chloroflexi bacterium]|jgi:hypothetical protein|nr:hypothetical protein [Chloroflexota bacterium]HPO58536.1 hypothetical protein [Anaerolineaceae bacterium]
MNDGGCPFPGLQGDPNTRLAFASDGNHCHHADPVEPVALEHQNQTCLSGDHVRCPVYLRAGLASLPPELVLRPERHAPRMPGRARLAAGAVTAMMTTGIGMATTGAEAGAGAELLPPPGPGCADRE